MLNATTVEADRQYISDPELFISNKGRDAFQSLLNLVNPNTGLPNDTPDQHQTTPSNIAGWLITLCLAPELDMCSRTEAVNAIKHTLQTLKHMPTYQGFPLNWIDSHTGKILTHWPGSEEPIQISVSTVDCGNLAMAYHTLGELMPEITPITKELLEPMDFNLLYESSNGLLRGRLPLRYDNSTNPPQLIEDTSASNWQYGALFTENINASFIGLLKKQLPEVHFLLLSMSQYMLQQSKQKVVGNSLLTWGGSLFETFPENFFKSILHPIWPKSKLNLISKQIKHGQEKHQGYFGFSPASYQYQLGAKTYSGYGEFGYLPESLFQTGYPDCLIPDKDDRYAEFEEIPVITPHALFLAMAQAPNEVIPLLSEIDRITRSFAGPGYPDSLALTPKRIQWPKNQLAWNQYLTIFGNYDYLTSGTLSKSLAPSFSSITSLTRDINPLNQPQVINAMRPHLPLNDQPLLDQWLYTIALPPEQINGQLYQIYSQVALAAANN